MADQTIQIPLTHGKFALVDAQDYEKLSRYQWRTKSHLGHWYARTTISLGNSRKRLDVAMHRLILGVERGENVDHINGDGLDNRRANLRVCNQSQNLANSVGRVKYRRSRFKGLAWHRGARKWQVQIMVNQKSKYLGLFESEEYAAGVYDKAARDCFGSFALTNF